MVRSSGNARQEPAPFEQQLARLEQTVALLKTRLDMVSAILEAAEDQKRKMVWERHWCDGKDCGARRGVRYHCEDCYNFDLCHDCYLSDREHAGHRFTAIKEGQAPPLKRARGVGVQVGRVLQSYHHPYPLLQESWTPQAGVATPPTAAAPLGGGGGVSATR